MQLDEFLSNPSFAAYSKTIDSIRSEFIAMDCEKFLWPSYKEELSRMDYTRKLEAGYGKISLNDNVAKFSENLSKIMQDNIVYIFPENYSPEYYMAKEISRKAKKSYVLENIFPEDDTINWIAIFDKSQEKETELMFRVVYNTVGNMKTNDNFGGYKLFHHGLMYYADCLQYHGQPLTKKTFAHFQGYACRRDNNPFLILESRKVSEMLIRLQYFPNEYELFYNLYHGLLPVLQEMYENAWGYGIDLRNKKVKEELQELKNRLIAEGTIARRWKSEQTLYTLVKQKYPKSIFQYHPQWLEPQSLDIYIPELNIGIEYQGIQHYQSIDFFGGEEAFLHRQKLDRKKKDLCAQNEVKLITWPYTDTISIAELNNKISEI